MQMYCSPLFFPQYFQKPFEGRDSLLGLCSPYIFPRTSSEQSTYFLARTKHAFWVATGFTVKAQMQLSLGSITEK